MSDLIEAVFRLIFALIVALIVLTIFDWDYRCLVVDCVIVKEQPRP